MANISTIKGLPVFAAEIADDTEGIVRVSLVDYPAVERDFVAFAEDEPIAPVITNEDAHIIRGVIMRANYPIFRSDHGGYWIVYRPEVIRKMAEKYIADNRANAVDLNHDGNEVNGVQLVQLYIKDSANGICPKGFEDIEDGSLFGEFHCENAEIWKAIKAGTYRGFSIEIFNSFTPSTGVHSTEKIADILEWLDTKLSLDMSIKTRLAKMLARFGAVTTDKGIIHWEGDADLAEGMEVWAETEDGERTDLEDGDYTIEDGKIIVIEGGKVVAIKDNEAEVAPAEETEEMAEDEPIAEDTAIVEEVAEEVAEETAEEVATEVVEDNTAELVARIEALENRIAEIEANVASLVDILDGVTTATEFKTARDRYKAHKAEEKKDDTDKFASAIERAKAIARALNQ